MKHQRRIVAHDLAQVEVADDAAAGGALDVQLLHHALFDDRDAGLLRGPVDQDVLAHDVSLVLLQQASRTPAARSSWAVSCAGRPMMPE